MWTWYFLIFSCIKKVLLILQHHSFLSDISFMKHSTLDGKTPSIIQHILNLWAFSKNSPLWIPSMGKSISVRMKIDQSLTIQLYDLKAISTWELVTLGNESHNICLSHIKLLSFFFCLEQSSNSVCWNYIPAASQCSPTRAFSHVLKASWTLAIRLTASLALWARSRLAC